MKKKGFTLIELLAVIVIIAIIALIATPITLNIIEKARIGAAKASAQGYVDAVKNQMMVNLMDGKSDLTNTVLSGDDLDTIEVSGERPSEGWVQITNSQIVGYSLKIGEYVVTYDGANTTVEVKEHADSIPSGSTSNFGGVIDKTQQYSVAEVAQEGLVGVAYFDPTDLAVSCDSNSAVSTTGTKTGCMKWYIYAEDSNSYTMILDHNTTATQVWNSSVSNTEYENSEIKEVVDALVSTSGWKVTPRLISKDEVTLITGASSGYFEGSQKSGAGTSKFAWLYDYTNECTSYGCNTADSSIYSYWTSTNLNGTVTQINNEGCFMFSGSYRNDSGIRPVITVAKSLLQ